MSKIKGYSTEYKTQNRNFISYIIATNECDLENKTNMRGLNEKVTSKRRNLSSGMLVTKLSQKQRSYFLDRSNSLHILHYACFLCFLAIRAGRLSGSDILSDAGYMHDFIHFFLFDIDKNNEIRLNMIIEKLQILENMTIGIFPE